MRRWIFNIVAAISLVLCLVTAGLWVRSEFRADGLAYAFLGGDGTSENSYLLASGRGLFLYIHEFGQTRSKPFPQWFSLGWHKSTDPVPSRGQIVNSFRRNGFCFFGFGYVANTSTNYKLGTALITRNVQGFLIPLWFVMLLLALAPARWLVLKRREIRLRRPRHLCKNCGYDLRATPDANGPLLDRCPECGTEAPAPLAGTASDSGDPTGCE